MARHLESDRFLFGATVVLVVIGAVMVFSASAVIAEVKFNSSYYFLIRQLIWVAVGLAAMVVLMYVDYHYLCRPQVIFPLVGLQFVLLVGVLFAGSGHSTQRWFRLGLVSFQPAEFSKIALILFVAYFLHFRRGAVNDWRHTLLPIGLVVGASLALVVRQPDFGTALAIGVIAAAMLFVSGLRLRYFAAALVAVIPLMYFLVFRVRYRYDRLLAFWDPYADPLGKGFQVIQSLMAVGTGGITGVGLMESKQKLFYLPEPQTDFIFAVICEELGLIGAGFVLALFGVILWRGLRAALNSKDEFGRLLAVGITFMVVGQALINISVVLGLLPTKGIPLPLVSYGGSSLLMTLLALGILLNISQHAS